jgi:hypothetical protein
VSPVSVAATVAFEFGFPHDRSTPLDAIVWFPAANPPPNGWAAPAAVIFTCDSVEPVVPP